MITAKDLAKRFEGLRLKAYPDVTGIPTIGYGHTGPDVHFGMTISESEAEEYLDHDLIQAEKIIDSCVTSPINENQFQALVDFVFNIGPGKKDVKSGLVFLKDGNPSTLLRELNVGNTLAAAREFLKWDKAGGVELAGLKARRQAEKELFESV